MTPCTAPHLAAAKTRPLATLRTLAAALLLAAAMLAPVAGFVLLGERAAQTAGSGAQAPVACWLDASCRTAQR